MAKKLFNSEINQTRKLASLLSFSLKLNGKMIILREENQKKLKEAIKLLEAAANILIEIN